MTITGRTTPKWGRDRSARWDSHAENGYRTRSYPHVLQKETLTVITTPVAELTGRPGYAERSMVMARGGDDLLTVRLEGWYDTTIELNARQITFLRDMLNAWFPEESHPR
jgi:hypothetical protein